MQIQRSRAGQVTSVARKKESAVPPTSESVVEGPHDVCELSASTAAASEPPKNSPFSNYLATIAAASLSGLPGAMVGLQADSTMYHGSSAGFDRVEPRPNRRVNSDGTTKWQGTAIFAAMDPRVGLHYTANRGTGIGVGIDLVNHTAPDEPVSYYLGGGASQEEALDRAYGVAGTESADGYLYLLDKSKFVKEPGLGDMEMITRDPEANLFRLHIDRRKAIDELVKSGDVVINWDPT